MSEVLCSALARFRSPLAVTPVGHIDQKCLKIAVYFSPEVPMVVASIARGYSNGVDVHVFTGHPEKVCIFC